MEIVYRKRAIEHQKIRVSRKNQMLTGEFIKEMRLKYGKQQLREREAELRDLSEISDC